MMKRYKMFATLGFILVIIAFGFSLLGADANAAFFAVDKTTREGAAAGTAVVAANALRHSIPTWVPALKFVGLGLMLGSITMALGGIAQTLRDLGANLMANWPAEMKPGMIAKPRTAKLFPMLMMVGWMVLLIGSIWAFVLNGTVVSYWSNSVATALNPAEAGSALLAQLGTIQATLPWLAALRFLGMALLFSAITLALTVIIRTLQFQEKSLLRFAEAAAKS